MMIREEIMRVPLMYTISRTRRVGRCKTQSPTSGGDEAEPVCKSDHLMWKNLMSGEERHIQAVIDWLRDDGNCSSVSSLLGSCSAAV